MKVKKSFKEDCMSKEKIIITSHSHRKKRHVFTFLELKVVAVDGS